MNNVYSYLKWRGDLDLSASAFNEADSLILSIISYVNFDGIVPGVESEESITMKEASDKYWSIHENIEKHRTKSFAAKPPLLLKEASCSKRFGSIRICKYVNRIDVDKEKQFSATTFQLGDDSIYLAYRGTDGTIVGWKEDFNMSFIQEVPAQSEAVEYLEGISGPICRSIRIGGHSKGGNLAIYSSVKCSGQIRGRILAVHNFDGPGFTKEMLISNEYVEMLPRITSYLPQASIIGMLLEYAGDRKIIKSSESGGILQHDPFSWEVDAFGFPCLKELDKSSLLMDSIIKEWINRLDIQQREYFVDTLFGILADTGIERTSDFSRVSSDRTKAFLKSISSMPVEKREVFTDIMKLFFAETRNTFKKELKNNFRFLNRQRTRSI